ncbi:MAG: protein-L-isoaspartate O-methyltransferase, partial [Candidatus Bathyarchaeia archaeon]
DLCGSARRNMVSIMNEALKLSAGQTVLEIGTGCGWHAATVAEIVAPSNLSKDKWGHVYTIEIISKLADFAKENIFRTGYSERVTVICKDGSEGYAEKAPFDRIYVTAAAPYVPPPLKEQLKKGGIMVIPVGAVGFFQTLLRLTKVNDEFIEEDLGGVAFVPLVGKHGHRLLY